MEGWSRARGGAYRRESPEVGAAGGGDAPDELPRPGEGIDLPQLRTVAGGDVEGEEGQATRLASFFRGTSKPVVFSVDSGPLYDPLERAMRRAGLPTFRRIDRATRALARFVGLAR